MGTFLAGTSRWKNNNNEKHEACHRSPEAEEARDGVAGRLADRFFELEQGLGRTSDRIRARGEKGAGRGISINILASR